MNATSVACHQCHRAAYINGLCLDCYHKLQVALTLDWRRIAIGMNYAAAEMDHAMPIGGPSPRMQVPEIPRGSTVLNNIKIDNSVVGAINTGNVHAIDVNISHLKHAGGDEVSEALAQLTEAIANDKTMPDAERRRLLDQVEFVTEQAVKGADARRPGMITAALGALDATAKSTASLAAIWKFAHPILKHVFGIG
jgi:hypothetical protein